MYLVSLESLFQAVKEGIIIIKIMARFTSFIHLYIKYLTKKNTCMYFIVIIARIILRLKFNTQNNCTDYNSETKKPITTRTNLSYKILECA